MTIVAFGRLTMFAMGVKSVSFSGQISASFIFIFVCSKVSEGERRRMQREQEKVSLIPVEATSSLYSARSTRTPDGHGPGE